MTGPMPEQAASDGAAINSKQYWDERFRTDWVSAGGHGQTRFFATVAAKAMPDWLKDRIVADELSICDWGCAEGQGVDELCKWLGTTRITGVDISDVAIAKARQAFPQASFEAQGLDQLGEYDIIFSSNTLEHFDHPFEVVQKLATRARKYLVFLLPFQEYDRLSEHFFTFDFDCVPVLPAPGFACVACRVIDTARIRPDFWNGRQLLVTYARIAAVEQPSPSIGGLFIGDDSYEAWRQDRLEAVAQPLQQLPGLAAQMTGLAQTQHDVRALAERQAAELALARAEIESMRAALVQQQASLAGVSERYDDVVARERQTLHEAAARCDDMRAQRDTLAAERDAAASLRDEAIRQRDQAIRERDEARGLLADAQAAHDRLQAHSAALHEELQVIRLSRAWRLRNMLRPPR